jgi:hypothetical protein
MTEMRTSSSREIDLRVQEIWENQRKSPAGLAIVAAYDPKYLKSATTPTDPGHWSKYNGEPTEFSKILVDTVSTTLLSNLFLLWIVNL